MKRRDVLSGVPAGLVGGLVAGTALSDAQPRQHPNLSWGPQPHYFVLWVFDRGFQDFIPIGIYTQRADAETHQERVKAVVPANSVLSGAIIEHSHEELCYRLAELRLGALATKLQAILELPRTPNEAENDRHRERNSAAYLYDKSEFPIAVAAKS